MEDIPQKYPKASYSPKTAAQMTDTRLPTIYEELKKNRLRGRRVGQRIIILHDDLMEWLHGLPDYGEPMGGRTKLARQIKEAEARGFA